MTAPVEALLPTCTVWIDGERAADGCLPGETPETPVILTGLEVVWGRGNTLDQPESGTCQFKVLDMYGAPRFTDLLYIGAQVDVKAEAMVFPDPDQPVFTWDPGFEGMVVGQAPPATVFGATIGVVAGPAPIHAGSRSLVLDPTPKTTAMRVVFPPAAYGGVSAWDAIPRTAEAQTWKYGMSVYLPGNLGGPQRAKVYPVAFTQPNANSFTVLTDFALDTGPYATGWQTMASEFEPDEGVWLGVAVDILPAGGTQWDMVVPANMTWDSLPADLAWDQVGRVYLDDLVLLAPAGGALRRSTVFTGRVTDLRSQYDLDVGGTVVSVVCQTQLAELDNRYVGSAPWLVEPLGNRFDKIVVASGQPISYLVDSSVAGYQVTWRDVDNQPAAKLLQELAVSVGGALWSAASDVGGTFLWLEDINNRPSFYHLVKDPDGIIRIHQGWPTNSTHVIDMDSCEVLLEPLTWVQTVEDNATRVVATWKQQTVDDQGQQKPVDVDETARNAQLESLTGVRRIQITTQLSQQDTARHVAESILARLTTPGWRLTGIHWQMNQTEHIDGNTLDRVMTLLDGVQRMGLGILLTNIPEWAPPASNADVAMFLEGGRYVNQDGAWSLELLTSSAAAQGASTVHWDDLPQVRAATRTNLLPNPQDRAGGASSWGTRGFGTGGAGTFTHSQVVVGPQADPTTWTACRKTWTTAATNNNGSGFTVRSTATKWVPVTPGDVLTISAYVRFAGSGTRTIQMILQFFTGTDVGGEGSVVSQPTNASQSINPNTWTRMTLTVTVPATANSVGVFPDVIAGGTLWAVGNTMDCTGVMVEKAAAVGPYFDGSNTDVANVTDYAWAGSAWASASTQSDMQGWTWDQVDPTMTWNDLYGVGMGT